ncbi:MAG: AraC family transcriptional regulator [Kiritimatiellae bacterium]|jgi:AraC-like DNA-binding protein|nr:AraC family transcriptional regulator [Kiritimatiellia bacterium]
MPKPKFFSKYYQDTPILREWPFRVRSLGYNRYDPHTKVPSGMHPDDHLFSWEHGRVLPTITLVHVAGGKGHFRSEPSGTLAMPRNSILFVHPGVRHAYGPNKKTGWDDQWVEMDAVRALPLMQQSGVTPENPIKVLSAAPQLSLMFQELFDLSQAEEFGTEQKLAACTYRIITHALTLWQSHAPLAKNFAVVERMRQYMLSDLAHTPSIATAASKAGLSASRLRVIFKEATGLSPKQFQLEARIDRAERLLTDSTLSIGHISDQTGFESVYHFSRQFKRMRGVSPLHYRTSQSSLKTE